MDVCDSKPAIEYFAAQQIEEFNLILQKWPILKELKYILGILYRATISLQHRELTLSDTFGIWKKVEIHLNACCAQKHKFKIDLPKHLLSAIISRESMIFNHPLMACALYLDPRYRRRIMNNMEKVEEAKRTLLNLWHRTNDESNAADNDRINLSTESTNSSIDLNFDEHAELDKYLSGDRRNIQANLTHQTSDIEILIETFDPEPLSSNQSIRNYWEMVKKDHPELYRLANVIFSIPPSEVQIERDFSKLNYVFGDRRCMLAKERLEDIMLLNLNPDLFYAVKADELEELEKQMNKN